MTDSGSTTTGVLFVCLGNICRSPMAEVVFRHLVQEAELSHRIRVASAGTSSEHLGQPPHPGTTGILRANGLGVGNKHAAVLTQTHFQEYPYVIAMDGSNAHNIQMKFNCRVPRLLEFAPKGTPLDVPDPYYEDNFEEVYELVQAGCRGLLAYIRQKEGL